MSDPDPNLAAHQEVETSESRWQAWALRLLPAVTFLLGIGLGVAVMTASGNGGTDEASPDGDPSASATLDPGESGDTVVTVPGACEDAAANLDEAVRLFDDVAGSVRDFQPQRLVELLDELETLDQETRPLVEQCQEVSVEESPSSDPSAEVTDEPTE